MEQKDYHKKYYNNKYKEIISKKRSYCDCCQLEFASWNIYKHMKTRKHIMNSMNEEDKLRCLEEKSQKKILQKIEKLTQLLKN